ncbi:MAG: low-specificity L-threonine aldolase [Candidatus Dormibacteraeota bacterium]|nr:low-specificity L-threonine aldolase [Candidatus Dormibacteraeota bacterium]
MSPSRIDLRSDTLTVPDDGMRAAMAAAEVGDDVWGEDPTVSRLEERVAELLGKGAAVFVPSGTMGNLASVAAQTSPGDEVIVDAQAHIVLYEVGGTAVVAGVQLRTLDGSDPVPDAAMVRRAIRAANIHHPVSRLLCVENTHNRRGGAATPAERIEEIAGIAHEHGLRVHCDGARLLNAAIALGVRAAQLVSACDTVSLCLSKGLGAPVGSVVAGDENVIGEVRRWRKRLGGGMRQAGIVAAAGLYALDHNVDRLADDHANAALIADRLREAAACTVAQPPVPTNILVVETRAEAAGVAARAAERGVLTSALGPHVLRCVTHLNVDRDQCIRASDVLAQALNVAA